MIEKPLTTKGTRSTPLSQAQGHSGQATERKGRSGTRTIQKTEMGRRIMRMYIGTGEPAPEERKSLAQARKPWVSWRKRDERRRCGTESELGGLTRVSQATLYLRLRWRSVSNNSALSWWLRRQGIFLKFPKFNFSSSIWPLRLHLTWNLKWVHEFDPPFFGAHRNSGREK